MDLVEIRMNDGPLEGEIIKEYKTAGDLIMYHLPIFFGFYDLHYKIENHDGNLIAKLDGNSAHFFNGYKQAVGNLLAAGSANACFKSLGEVAKRCGFSGQLLNRIKQEINFGDPKNKKHLPKVLEDIILSQK